MHVNVRIGDVRKVGVCMMCVDNSEESECGVGAGVNVIVYSISRRVRMVWVPV